MDKLQWFKFTPSDWMMGKIMRCDDITQARYLRLCCLYWNKECELSLEDAEIEVDEQYINILTKKKIVKVEGDFIRIEFLDEQMEGVLETSEKRRRAANKRWNKKNANDMQVHASALQNDAEESRVEETRVEKNNIDNRKLEFSYTLEPYLEIYGQELLKDFFLYWTEPNKSNTKFRQELQKTWSVERRLSTWAKNDKNFNGKPNLLENEKFREFTNGLREGNPNV